MAGAHSRTRLLPWPTRLGIVLGAFAVLAGAVLGAIRRPHGAPAFAVAAFLAVAGLLMIREARVTLTDEHLVVHNPLRVYAIPLAGIRRPVIDVRGGVGLIVYFHPDYPSWPDGRLPPGWRAKHRRKRLRQVRVLALAHDDDLLPLILRRAVAAREGVEAAAAETTGPAGS